MQHAYSYYKISYVHIAKNLRRYRTISHTIFLSCSTWAGVCGGWRWSCPWSTHRSCLMIPGPPLWSVLHFDSPQTLSLHLANHTATNVSGDCLIRAKIGISLGAWAAIITPTAHKVIECDRLRHISDGRVRQAMFLCKMAE